MNVWHIDGAVSDELFATEGEAIAAAWARTPPGGTRPEVRLAAVIRERLDSMKKLTVTMNDAEKRLNVKGP